MKKGFDTVIVFRWDSRKERFICSLASKSRLTVSKYIRKILDSFISQRADFQAFEKSEIKSKFIQGAFDYGNKETI